MSLPVEAIHRHATDRDAGTACPCCRRNVLAGDPLAICPSCATIHHETCWWTSGGCGSYVCAPARRDLKSAGEIPLRISALDLERTVPLPPRVTYTPPADPMPAKRGRNGMATASFVAAIMGIPLVGVITGLVAVLLGSLALGAISRSRQKGTGLAIAGVMLGLADVVGWIFFLWFALSRPGPALQIAHFQPDLAALKNLDPKLDRAMRANVLIQSQAGWFGQGLALGSGVILKIENNEALILTNRHVVDPNFAGGDHEAAAGDAPKNPVLVEMVGQTAQPGRVAWIAPDGVDLALVRVACRSKETRATRWKIGRPSAVGDPVFAIGNPHGLGWTHTQGAVSQFRVRDIGPHKVRIIQTQTSINAGNSGGGLYDKDGYLIGINTWTEDKRVSEGLNFAIMLDILNTLNPPGLDVRAGSEEADKP